MTRWGTLMVPLFLWSNSWNQYVKQHIYANNNVLSMLDFFLWFHTVINQQLTLCCRINWQYKDTTRNFVVLIKYELIYDVFGKYFKAKWL